MIHAIPRSWATVVVTAALVGAVACDEADDDTGSTTAGDGGGGDGGGDGGDGGDGGGTSGQVTEPSGASTTGGGQPSAPATSTGGGTEVTTAPTASTSTTGSTSPGGPVTDPQGPDVQLFTVPECDVVPGGALSGADVLNMYVSVRNGGPGEIDRLVPIAISSDTGLSSSLNSGISAGSAVSAMQVDLDAAAYDRRHRFTVTADPADEIVERDESNNSLQITVDLPAAPAGYATVPCTSP